VPRNAAITFALLFLFFQIFKEVLCKEALMADAIRFSGQLEIVNYPLSIVH